MAVRMMGAELTPRLASWGDKERRVGSVLAVLAAVLVVAAAVAVYLLIGDKPTVNWSLAGVLMLVLVFTVAVLATGGGSATRTPEGHDAHPHMGPAGPAGPDDENAAATSDTIKRMSLRCGDCSTVFDIADTGERPLYHTCPGCGAEGVLRDPAPVLAPPPAPAPPMAEPEEYPEGEPAPAPAPAPAAAPSPLTAPRRLKLRCGGCKEVFVIEDSGERPLRRPCPHCGRMGEVR